MINQAFPEATSHVPVVSVVPSARKKIDLAILSVCCSQPLILMEVRRKKKKASENIVLHALQNVQLIEELNSLVCPAIVCRIRAEICI